MVSQKSVVLAVLLNLFIPGLGYIYMGRVLLGVAAFFLAVPAIIVTYGLGWFGWALIMSIDMLILKSRQERAEAAKLKKCPQCAEMVQAEAKMCRFCRHSFRDARLASVVDGRASA